MMRPARRRFGRGCAIPVAHQFTTGAGGVSPSTTVAAPTATTSADDVSAGAAGGSSKSSKKSSAGGEEDDDLVEDPKYYSACTFQHRSKDGLPEGEKKSVSEAGSADYPVMKFLGMARTVQGEAADHELPGDKFYYLSESGA